MTKHNPPQVPYVEARHQGGKQKPSAIILSASFTTSDKGAALGVASMWHAPSSSLNSGHYVVDEATVLRCVYDNVVPGHPSLTDKGALRITVCAEPISSTRFWDSVVHYQVLRRTAILVADLCLAYNIRARYLDDASLNKWKKFRTRRRGGIYLNLTSDFPAEPFLEEVETQKALRAII